MTALHASRIRGWALAALCWFAAWHVCEVAQAFAFPARVLVVSQSNVRSKLYNSARSVLSGVAELADARQYRADCRRAGLDPRSDRALTTLAPRLGVRLLVLLSVRGGKLVVAYRDPSTGQHLTGVTLPLPRGKLDSSAQARLRDSTRRVLASMTTEPAPAAEPVEIAQPAPTPRAAGIPSEPPTELIQEIPRNEPDVTAQPVSEPPPSEAAVVDSTAAAARSISARLGVGAGFGQRSVRLPTRAGDRALAAGIFPALDLLLSGDALLGSHGLLSIRARYQTSLGLTAEQTPPGGVAKRTSLRTHRLELGGSPGFRFAATEDSASLRLFLGWSWRGLRSVLDFDIPPYTLSAFVIRPELRVSLAGGRVVLRFEPELMIVAAVTTELRHLGATAGSGLAFGGEAALEVALGQLVQLALSYRESRATVSSAWAGSFTDIERFATLQVLLRY